MPEPRNDGQHESPAIVEIPLNGEHGLRLDEDIFDVIRGNGLMASAYSAALSALKGILQDDCPENANHNEESHFSREEKWHGVQKWERHSPSERFYEWSSNIIAFCGDRGQGKTSVMMSFTNALKREKNLKRIKERWEAEDKEDGETASRTRYPLSYVHVLPPIDPTRLEGGEMLMEAVLSRMLNFFHRHQPNIKDYLAREDRRRDFQAESTKLYRKFKNCLDSVRKLKSGEHRDTLEELDRYGESLDLQTNFYDLVLDFFKMLGKDEESSYLLVRLDDADLQFKKAYEILEEVRKYLALPNVLVVMAIRLDQLRMLIKQSYYKDLEVTLKTSQGFKDEDVQRRTLGEIHNMVAKYIDKLIPATHAIYLPTVRSAFNNSSNKESAVHLRYGHHEPEEIHKAVFGLIYRKTGLFFIRHRYYMHSIIPGTLRGLAHLLRFLRQMPQPPSMPKFPKQFSENENFRLSPEWEGYCKGRLKWAEQTFANLLRFEDYFLNDWCSSRVDDNNWQIIRELIQDAAPAKAVQHAVDVLQKKKENLFTDKNNAGQADQGTTQEQANTYVALTKLVDPEAIGYTRHDYLFAFALHTYFSIHFHKVVLEEQIESLRNELCLLEEQTESLRNELRLSEEQRNTLHNELRRLGETCFSFDYSRLQTLLNPQVFDTEYIQKELSNKLGIDAPKISFELSRRQEALIIKKSLFVRKKKDVGSLIDPLYCFYQALVMADGLIEADSMDEQRRILQLQDYSTFVCCNWDVQEQIIKSMIGNKENSEKFRQTVYEDYKPTGTITHMDAFFRYIVEYIAKKESNLGMWSAWNAIPKEEEPEKTLLREYFVDHDALFEHDTFFKPETIGEFVRRSTTDVTNARKFVNAVKKATPKCDQETKAIIANAESALKKAEERSRAFQSWIEDDEINKADIQATCAIAIIKDAVERILDKIADIADDAAKEANDADAETTQKVEKREKAAKKAKAMKLADAEVATRTGQDATHKAEVAFKVAQDASRAAKDAIGAGQAAKDAAQKAKEAFSADDIDTTIKCAVAALAKADEATKAAKDAKQKAAPRKRGNGRKPKDAPTPKNPDEANDGNSGGDAS